jgi:FKBP-type peptidyl-prolyl cis-trans isomerase
VRKVEGREKEPKAPKTKRKRGKFDSDSEAEDEAQEKQPRSYELDNGLRIEEHKLGRGPHPVPGQLVPRLLTPNAF